jgi:predicted alpha/beta superfamily hydrolase
MSFLRQTVIAVAILAGAGSVSALQDSFSLAGTQIHPLPTAENDVNYELYIRVSPSCRRDTPCPAVYMLDAEYSFGLAALIAEHLEDRGQLQPLILVGVSYQDKTQYRLNRSRDYTPVFVAEGGYGPSYQALSGGGNAFLDVLSEHIIPYVEQHFPASSTRRGLVGHSFGGLFTTYAMLERPDLFDRYLSVSPSYWYGEHFILAHEQENHAPLTHPIEVYFGVGELEERPGTARAMVSDMLHFAAQKSARGDENYRSTTEVIPGQTHASIFPLALSNGLRSLYPPARD